MNNVRPICLVNVTRKILSKIVLLRIQDTLESYLCLSQAAFRKKRSTSDILWSYKFVMATAVKYHETFYVMGLDLSKAYDTVNRKILLEILKDLIGESELRMVRYLLGEMDYQIRVNRALS